MANLTITVDAEILRRARIRALERNESVNAVLAEAVKRYAEDLDQSAVFADLDEIARKSRSGSQGTGRAWTRDELHRG